MQSHDSEQIQLWQKQTTRPFTLYIWEFVLSPRKVPKRHKPTESDYIRRFFNISGSQTGILYSKSQVIDLSFSFVFLPHGSGEPTRMLWTGWRWSSGSEELANRTPKGETGAFTELTASAPILWIKTTKAVVLLARKRFMVWIWPQILAARAARVDPRNVFAFNLGSKRRLQQAKKTSCM